VDQGKPRQAFRGSTGHSACRAGLELGFFSPLIFSQLSN